MGFLGTHFKKTSHQATRDSPIKAAAMRMATWTRSYLFGPLLPGGPIGATKPSHSDVYELNIHRSHLSGRLVAVGLVVEIVVAFFWFRGWETALDIGAVILITAGVLGEIHFGNNARIAGDADIERYKAQTAKAELERVKLEAQLAPRSLSEEQFNIFQTLRGKIPALSVTSSSDFEATRFGLEIARTLAAAGIEVKIYPPRVGPVWANIYLVFPKPPISGAWEEPLFVAFRDAGLSVGTGWREQRPMVDLPPDIPIVMVGEKEIRHSKVPHALAVMTEAEPKYVRE